MHNFEQTDYMYDYLCIMLSIIIYKSSKGSGHTRHAFELTLVGLHGLCFCSLSLLHFYFW